MNAVRIGRYTMRRASLRDLPLVDLWLDQSDDHGSEVYPEFFCVDKDGGECLAFEGTHGIVLFYVRMTYLRFAKALWINLLFGPETGFMQRRRNGIALAVGFDWVRRGAQGEGIEKICFGGSTSPQLLRFSKSHLGFQSAPEGMVYIIPQSASNLPPKKACNSGSDISFEQGAGHVRK